MNSITSPKTTLYGRRKGRPLRKNKIVLISELLPKLVFTLTEAGYVPKDLFDPHNPLYLEIGYGTGDHLIAQLMGNPSVNIIGCEPFLGGIAGLLDHLEGEPHRHSRIKLFTQDAQSLLKGIEAQTIHKIFVLFPDPWPKKRHHKRRFVQETTLQEMIKVLKSTGTLTLASDHEDYFLEMEKLVNNHPEFKLLDHGILRNTQDLALRPPSWPMTRFERKAHQANRVCKYLIVQKI